MAERIGKYEVVELIGRGGMGTIYRARDSVLERSVALKVVSSLEVTPRAARPLLP
jgi:eukaryotic-like serine/threonine-protein kinase